MDFTLAGRARPCGVFPPTGQKPLIPNCFLAVCTALQNLCNALLAKFFLARSDAFLLTIRPVFDFVNVAAVSPPGVFCFRPLNTCARASLPLAMMLTRLAFMVRAFFITPLAFLAVFMVFFGDRLLHGFRLHCQSHACAAEDRA